MKINTFEAIGIGASIMAMVLALYFLRLGDVTTSDQNDAASQSAAVYVAHEDGQASVANALTSAATNAGTITSLVVDDVVIGTGEAVKEGDTITVNYIGTLPNGQQFDNSYSRGVPFTFTVGEGKVIPGWEQGVVGMKVGGQRILVVPSDMAYGDNGYGPIPGGATLMFAIELMEIK